MMHTPHRFPAQPAPARAARALLLAWLAFMPLAAQGADARPAVDPARVEIQVEHGIETPWGTPGFRIEIGGWQPNGDLSLYAIAPDGAQIALIPRETPVRANGDGTLTVDVGYARKGLVPGHWVFVAAGTPGIHEFETDLPRVEPPTAKHRKWRLVFGTPGKAAASAAK